MKEPKNSVRINEEEPEEEELNKKGLIPDKVKKSPATAVAILAAAFVTLIAVVVVSILFSVGRQSPAYHKLIQDSAVNVQKQKTLSYNEFYKQIKLLCFKYNIGEESVNERADVENSLPVFYIKTVVQQEDAELLRKDAVNLFTVNNIPILYSDDIYLLAGETDTFRVEFLIDKRKNFESAAPVPTPAPAAGKDNAGLPPPKQGKGKIAIIIDDAGMNLPLADRLTKIKIPITVAILPHLISSRETADLVRSRGKTVFMHYPMEPRSYPSDDPGEGAVLFNMPETLIEAVSQKNAESLGSIDGFNNHMGSAITEEPLKILQILESMRPYANVFVDSNTSNKSVAYNVCKEAGFSCGINKKFLDNSKEHADITRALYEAAEYAGKNGEIIAIGHLRADTVAVLETVAPELQKLGYQFVSVTSLTR
ncbi:MAG: divergent polysaccharide deacetylase family protein [Deferribacteraceae bacterium]|jgi:polysaccharide deacetylase 2 family uncharacterized protein YibQ|nr:divergent polysaccharide deacetylase family protein [Deferribacteraceae bacterium]